MGCGPGTPAARLYPKSWQVTPCGVSYFVLLYSDDFPTTFDAHCEDVPVNYRKILVKDLWRNENDQTSGLEIQAIALNI